MMRKQIAEKRNEQSNVVNELRKVMYTNCSKLSGENPNR